MARRNDHSREEIRSMAIEAAAAIVAGEGAGALSARKVAAAIGYTPGTLYLVFDNLDALILQVNAGTLDELGAALEQATRGCDEPAACLRALGQGYLAFAAEHGERWSLVFEHRLGEGRPLPDWMRARIDRLLGLVEAQLAALDPPRSGAQCRHAARALWSAVHGVCVLGLSGKLGVTGVASVRDLAEELIDDFLAGWAGRPAVTDNQATQQ